MDYCGELREDWLSIHYSESKMNFHILLGLNHVGRFRISLDFKIENAYLSLMG